MKTALFIILITESVLKGIGTMGKPATEAVPEVIVDSEIISTYATEMPNSTNNTENDLSTYATQTITEIISNERETTSGAEITLNATNSENGDKTNAMETKEPIDRDIGIPRATAKILKATNVRDNNAVLTNDNSRPSLTIPKERIIDNEIGMSTAPQKLEKRRLEKKISSSAKGKKINAHVKIGRSKEKALNSIQVSLGSEHQEITHVKKNINTLKLKITKPDKAFLRYGFQKTKHCQDYEKAFMCMRKCLDLGYDLANADKNCVCTCRRNRILHMHKRLIKLHSSTPWKGGAPTTSLPPWVIKQSSALPKPVKNPENQDYEVYGDVSFSNKSGEGHASGGEGEGGEVENATEGSGEDLSVTEKANDEGDGADDGEAKGEDGENATKAEGEAGEGGEGGETTVAGEAAEGGEGGEAPPAEEGEATAEPEEAPAEEP